VKRWLSRIAAAALAAGGAQAAAPAEPPVRLALSEGNGQVRIEVVGLAPATYEASYSLIVTTGQGNHSASSGNVRLQPNIRTVVAAVTVGDAGGRWNARLRVEPATGSPYEEVRGTP
jgi:hypothetical protein